MSSNLEIAPDAKFTVQIDPKSGDYLTVSGSAKLDIDIDRSGKQSVNGTYEVKSGNYQVSFYGLVKKSFSIEPGSTVTCLGDLWMPTLISLLPMWLGHHLQHLLQMKLPH